MSNDEQLFFDLFAQDRPEEKVDLFSFHEAEDTSATQSLQNMEAVADISPEYISTKEHLAVPAVSPKNQRRAIIGWLATQSPNSIGIGVPTRISRYKADVAAFWSTTKGKLLTPEKTIVVEIRGSRAACWPDCGKSDQLIEKLVDLKRQRTDIQEYIRATEPQLRDMDTLFEEYQIWNYDESRNEEYQRVRSQIEKTEEALYKGSRFQQISSAEVADLLYLAVPAGVIKPHEIADHWGLLYINEDMSIEVIQEAEYMNCPDVNRLHLVQNIAQTTYNSLLFAQGIQQVAEEKIVYTPLPRRRRAKKQNSYL